MNNRIKKGLYKGKGVKKMGISISGLASGMDTDSMVTELINIERLKVDNVKADKQISQWKQTEYRNVTNQLKDFQSGFLDIAKPENCLRSANTFNAFTASSTTGGINATSVIVAPTAYSQLGSHTISNIRVAKSDNWMGNDISEMKSSGVDPQAISAGDTVDFEVDGVRKTMVLDGPYITVGALASDLQSKFNSSFGDNVVSVSEDVGSGELSFSSPGHTVKIYNTLTDDELSVNNLGFSHGDKNTLNFDYSLGEANFANDIFGAEDTIEFTINDIDFSFSKDGNTVTELFNEVNNSDAGVKFSYSELTNEIVMSSKEEGLTNQIDFIDTKGSFLSSGIGIVKATDIGHSQVGADASFTLDNVATTRSLNDFKIDGINYTLKADSDDVIDINIDTSTADVKKTITSFVEKYNELLGSLNDKVSEKRYTDYPPLTDDEKKAMSEDEIEQWDEKAQSGMLLRDGSIQTMLYEMRQSLYSSVDSSGLKLYDMGITTTNNYLDGGKLVINETKLDSAIKTRPDDVRELFSAKDEGIAYKLNDVIEKNISITGDKGILLQKAGLEGTTTETRNALSDQMKQYDKRIEKLLDDLQVKEDYYFSMFAQMEKALQTMNDQSDWMAGQFASM